MPVEDDTATVSVIIVVRNDRSGLERTTASVVEQTQANREFIVVDGASTDDTRSFLDQNRGSYDVLISEPDLGIYNAMNKALRTAKGEWVIFMNAGDCFVGKESLSRAMKQTANDVDVIYSDVVFVERDRRWRVTCELNSPRLHHQSIVYRATLHEQFGGYVTGRDVTISDYIFFLSVLSAPQRWRKLDEPISVCDASGKSSRPNAYYQKLATDLIFGRKGRVTVALMLLAYPVYRWFFRPVVKVLSRSKAS